MRKTIFFSPIFLFLCGGIFISCHFLADISTEEKVKILFPVWPPVEMDGGGSGDVGSVDGDTRAGAVDTGVGSEDTRVDNGDTEGASFTASGDTEDTENTGVSNVDTGGAQTPPLITTPPGLPPRTPQGRPRDSFPPPPTLHFPAGKSSSPRSRTPKHSTPQTPTWNGYFRKISLQASQSSQSPY